MKKQINFSGSEWKRMHRPWNQSHMTITRLAAALLAAGVCLMAFAGCAQQDGKDAESQPLTALAQQAGEESESRPPADLAEQPDGSLAAGGFLAEQPDGSLAAEESLAFGPLTDLAASPLAGPASCEPQAVLDRIMENDVVLLDLATADGQGGGTCTASPGLGNGRNRQHWFTSPYSFSWSAADEPAVGGPALNGEKLVVSSPDGSSSLTFYSGSELVFCQGGYSAQWYQAENMSDPEDEFYDRSDIFNFMRYWYDEAEKTALEARAVIPDDGQSHEAVARAWAEAYEGAKLDLTPGNRFRCTYVDVRDVEVYTDYPRVYFPEYIGDREAFLIGYSVVFVPDDWRGLRAGNTVEYKGADAPEGAYKYWSIAYIYLDEDGWHSEGAMTG